MTVLMRIGHIAFRVVELAIIWFVFGLLQGRTENIIVPILGLLYVTIRMTALISGETLHAFAMATCQDLLTMKEQPSDPCRVSWYRQAEIR